MKKYWNIVAAMSAVMLFSACNLFIEDDNEDLTHGVDLNKKTVYTGDGWDEPKTEVSEDGYEVTYQYKDNVKLLDEEIQNYIVEFQMDPLLGAVGWIDFREDVPERMMPRIGEIVTARVGGRFPDGLGAEVMSAGYQDGVYRIGICSVTLDRVFKKLECEADLNFEKVLEDIKARQSQLVATTETPRRAPAAEDDDEDIDFDFNDPSAEPTIEETTLGEKDKIYTVNFKLPLKLKLKNKKLPKFKDKKTSVTNVTKRGGIKTVKTEESGKMVGALEIKKDESYIDCHAKLHFYLLNGLPYPIVEIKNTTTTHCVVHLTGGIEYSKTRKVEDVFHKTLKVSPKVNLGVVELKFLLGYDLNFNTGLIGDLEFFYDRKTYSESQYDLLDVVAAGNAVGGSWGSATLIELLKDKLGLNNSSSKVLQNDFNLAGSLEGFMKIGGEVKAGVGLWTEKISARLYLGDELNATLTSIPLQFTGESPAFDISGGEGFVLRNKFYGGLKIGASLNAYEIISTIQKDFLEIAQAFGDQLFRELTILIGEKMRDLGYVDPNEPIDLETADKMKLFLESCEEVLQEQQKTMHEALKDVPLDLEIPFEKTISDKKLVDLPWAPLIDGSTFSARLKKADLEKQTTTYSVDYLYKKKGMLVSSGFVDIYPCLLVTWGDDWYKNGTYRVETSEDGPDGTVAETTGAGYSIELPSNVEYNLYPAYRLKYGSGFPIFIDEAHSLTPVTPMVKITSIKKIDSGEAMLGMYSYTIQAKINVRGSASMEYWRLEFPIWDANGNTYVIPYKCPAKEMRDEDGKKVKITFVSYTTTVSSEMFAFMQYYYNDANDKKSKKEVETCSKKFTVEWSAFDFDAKQNAPIKKFGERPASRMPESVKQRLRQELERRPAGDKRPVAVVWTEEEMRQDISAIARP